MARTPRSGSTRRHLFHGLLLLVAGVLAACGNPVTPTAPTISSFTATPPSIAAGGSSTLAWSTVGATENTIRAGAAVVSTSGLASGSVAVTPTTTTTYTLTSTNATGETTRDVTVTVTGTPELPDITAFTATPATVAPGGTSTLAWTTTGATAVEIRVGDTVLTSGDQAAGSFDVTPDATTTYTLVASNAAGEATEDATVTVTPDGEPGTLTLTGASVVAGSQVALTWSTTGSPTGITVLAVDNLLDADAVVVTTVAGSATSATVRIPAAARQRLRVCAAFAAGPEACDQGAISGSVVTLATDYDPYALLGVTPDAPVPGTLRYVIDAAAAGSIIGFAADVAEVDLFGVATGAYAPLAGIQDAHLILDKNVTISGPATKVTLRGRSGWEVGDPGLPITYQSRMLFVAPGVTVVLENLVVTGGDFIFFGGGLRNNGNATLVEVDVVGNRSWLKGGGIWNAAAGATLTIQGGSVADNRSIVTDAERGTTYLIRGDASAEIPGTGNPFGDGGYGGGIYNEAGATVTIMSSAVTGNEAMVSGGGIYSDGTLTMSGTDVSDNDGSYAAYTPVDSPFALGGGVYVNGPFTFANGAIANNVASDIGGGLFVDADSLTSLTTVAITGNAADFSGGLHHRFCPGFQTNLIRVAVNISGNTPENENAEPNAGFCPTAAPATATAPTALPGRYAPPAGIDPAVLDR